LAFKKKFIETLNNIVFSLNNINRIYMRSKNQSFAQEKKKLGKSGTFIRLLYNKVALWSSIHTTS